MNPYKKTNNYLLVNHPLIWHSRALQLIMTGLFGWLISYIIGYNSVDLNVLNRKSILELYFSNFYLLFHIIYTLSIIVIWAIYFYRNNAFKHYYPIQKGYFTRLFFLLFIPFSLLVSFYIPYTAGAKSKTSTYTTEEELKADINKLNLAYPFLIENTERYDITNRVHPKPFPLSVLIFDKNSKSWGNSNLKIHTSKGVDYFDPNKYEHFQLNVDDQNMIFYSEHTEYIKHNKCESESVIYKLYNPAELENLHKNSIYNFSSILVQPYKEYNDINLFDSYYNEDDNSNSFKINYASKVAELVKMKRYSAIQNAIDEFKEVCKKYQIDHNLNSKHIIRYLSFKNFKNFKKSITRGYKDNYSFYNPEDEINQIESVLKHKKETIKYMSSQHVYFYDSYGIENIFQNFRNLDFPLLGNYLGLIFLFIALALTWLFICFEFTEIKSFLIAIPIAGVISIINSLILLNLPSGRSEFINILIVFITSFLLIIGTLTLGLFSKRMNKKLLTILLNLYYLIAPVFFLAFILLYNELTKTVLYKDCYGIQEKTVNSFLMNPYWFFVFSLLGILTFFPILKKWKAYEE